jgi:hypothetical protein
LFSRAPRTSMWSCPAGRAWSVGGSVIG